MWEIHTRSDHILGTSASSRRLTFPILPWLIKYWLLLVRRCPAVCPGSRVQDLQSAPPIETWDWTVSLSKEFRILATHWSLGLDSVIKQIEFMILAASIVLPSATVAALPNRLLYYPGPKHNQVRIWHQHTAVFLNYFSSVVVFWVVEWRNVTRFHNLRYLLESNRLAELLNTVKFIIATLTDKDTGNHICSCLNCQKKNYQTSCRQNLPTYKTRRQNLAIYKSDQSRSPTVVAQQTMYIYLASLIVLGVVCKLL